MKSSVVWLICNKLRLQVWILYLYLFSPSSPFSSLIWSAPPILEGITFSTYGGHLFVFRLSQPIVLLTMSQ